MTIEGSAVAMCGCLWAGFWLGQNTPTGIALQLRKAARKCKANAKFHGRGIFASTYSAEMIVDGEPYLVALMPKEEGASFAPAKRAQP